MPRLDAVAALHLEARHKPCDASAVGHGRRLSQGGEQAAPQRAAVRWRLDEQDLPEAASALPAPGRHRLRLLDAKGVVLDEIRFTVRGHAPVKP